jgi:glycosyltransferase involved in cell wall biosynthesis
MTSLRVAHVLRKYDPAQWGGTETHVAALAHHLPAQGCEVEVHAPLGPEAPDRALPPGVKLRRYHAFAPFLGPAAARRDLFANAGNIASLDEPLRLAFDRSLDLAHVHTQGRIGGAVRTAMRLTGRPYLVSVHGPKLAEGALVAAYTADRLEGLVDLGSPLGMLLGARRVLDDAARVICFNDDEHAALAARIGRRAMRMDHGVDRARFAAGDLARARARFTAFGDAPVVALVGRMAAQKNQLLAVRAFARGAPSDHHLALAGAETDAGYGALVAAEARALGVADRVHFLGNLAPESIPDLLARATLVVVPSTHEAFGLAVLEAWSAGKPVLFARKAGLADLARALPDESVAVPSLDEGAWIEKLRALLGDPGARAAAVSAGSALVAARFSWPKVAQRLDSLYREVLLEAREQRLARAKAA